MTRRGFFAAMGAVLVPRPKKPKEWTVEISAGPSWESSGFRAARAMELQRQINAMQSAYMEAVMSAVTVGYGRVRISK